MLTRVCPGYPPFYDDNPFGIYEKILSGKLEWPRHVEMTAKDLVKRLLVQVMAMLKMVIMMMVVMMMMVFEASFIAITINHILLVQDRTNRLGSNI